MRSSSAREVVGTAAPSAALEDLGILGLLHPAWRVVLGVCVAAAVVAVGWRLLRDGPPRMVRGMLGALLVVGALVALTVLLG